MIVLAHHGVESLLPAALGASVLVFHHGRAHIVRWQARRARRVEAARAVRPPS
jgi:hypothetical protein